MGNLYIGNTADSGSFDWTHPAAHLFYPAGTYGGYPVWQVRDWIYRVWWDSCSETYIMSEETGVQGGAYWTSPCTDLQVLPEGWWEPNCGNPWPGFHLEEAHILRDADGNLLRNGAGQIIATTPTIFDWCCCGPCATCGHNEDGNDIQQADADVSGGCTSHAYDFCVVADTYNFSYIYDYPSHCKWTWHAKNLSHHEVCSGYFTTEAPRLELTYSKTEGRFTYCRLAFGVGCDAYDTDDPADIAVTCGADEQLTGTAALTAADNGEWDDKCVGCPPVTVTFG